MDLKKRIIGSVLSGVLVGGLLTLLFPAGEWWRTWFSSAFLLTLSVFFLLMTVSWLENDRRLLPLTLTAFSSRFFIGLFFLIFLPLWGYDTDQQKEGYLFRDAFARDTASWQLAASDAPLSTVFDESFFEDQYGGLALLSSFVYRFLSPDTHRPFLILILSSFAFALGPGFFYQAVNKRWDETLALPASWLVILYPEGIFYTVSQMREPFVIGAAMILFWGVVSWFEDSKRKSILLLCIPTVLMMLLISWRASMGVIVLIALWWWIETIRRIPDQKKRRRHWLGMALALLVGTALVLVLGGEWLRYTIWWDMREMSLTSGWLVILTEKLPVPLQYAVTTVFGVLQVVLPGAVIETSIPLWKVVTILRSLGWYMMLPLLIVGFAIVWKEKDRKERWVWVFFLVFSWGWILFSSLRAGGDLWDNPRYRTILLPWLALLAVYFWQNRTHWLRRVVLVEGIALLLFTYWYLIRYVFFDLPQLPITYMIIIILGAAGVIFGHGMIQEWNSRRKQISNSSNDSKGGVH